MSTNVRKKHSLSVSEYIRLFSYCSAVFAVFWSITFPYSFNLSTSNSSSRSLATVLLESNLKWAHIFGEDGGHTAGHMYERSLLAQRHPRSQGRRESHHLRHQCPGKLKGHWFMKKTWSRKSRVKLPLDHIKKLTRVCWFQSGSGYSILPTGCWSPPPSCKGSEGR